MPVGLGVLGLAGAPGSAGHARGCRGASRWAWGLRPPGRLSSPLRRLCDSQASRAAAGGGVLVLHDKTTEQRPTLQSGPGVGEVGNPVAGAAPPPRLPGKVLPASSHCGRLPGLWPQVPPFSAALFAWLLPGCGSRQSESGPVLIQAAVLWGPLIISDKLCSPLKSQPEWTRIWAHIQSTTGHFYL